MYNLNKLRLLHKKNNNINESDNLTEISKAEEISKTEEISKIEEISKTEEISKDNNKKKLINNLIFNNKKIYMKQRLINNNINNTNNINKKKINIYNSKQINVDISNNNIVNSDILNKNIIDNNYIEKYILHSKKSDILCVTTFNKKLYDSYAYKFIQTYNLPFDLIIYTEDDLVINENPKYNYTIINSTNVIPEMNDFINKNKLRNINDKIKLNFLGDGIRFCYKVFAVTHAGLTFTDYKYLIWLDADILFKNSFNINYIETELTTPLSMMSFLGRYNQYSECGFLIFNMKHEYINYYFKEMKRMYVSNDIYKLNEYHDSYIWDYVRLQFETKFNVETFSITEFNMNNDVLSKSKLFTYLVHLKGNRKYN